MVRTREGKRRESFLLPMSMLSKREKENLRVKITARMMKNIHLSAMIVWMCLLVPSLIWWKESVPWLVFMSLYANFVGHFSSWQAARGERMQEKRDEKEAE